MAILQRSRFSLVEVALSLAIICVLGISKSFGATLWVDQSFQDTESKGTRGEIFRTIQAGADRAKPGDTVIVKSGVYRESIRLKHGGNAGQPIRFHAQGAVIVDGADIIAPQKFREVTSEEERRSGVRVWRWDGYQARFRLSPGGTAENDATRDGWASLGPAGVEQIERYARADMLWIDSRLASEVRQRGALKPSQFWVEVDGAAKGLYLALAEDDLPENHVIEVSVREVLLSGQVSHIIVEGFHFTRASNWWDSGAITLPDNANDWTITGNRIDWNSWSGLHLHGTGHRIIGNDFCDNGAQGLSGANVSNVLFERNQTSRNNWKKFRWEFQGGGMKLCWAKGIRVIDHVAGENLGPGIWFDIDCENISVERSRVHHNTYAGIFFELATGGAVVRDNYCYANDGAGIFVAESRDVKVEHNLLFSNKRGLELRNIVRDVSTQDVQIHDNFFVDNGIGVFAPDDLVALRTNRNLDSSRNLFWGNLAWGTYSARPWWDFSKYISQPTTGLRSFDLEATTKELGFEKDSVIRNPHFDPVLKATYELVWP
ncbi:MAG TPA: right-handed parallel beta-helix repeat-containing protein [Chthoniobacterales bacterium]